MISEAIKLFELLLRQFDKDAELEKSFLRDRIDPLFVAMQQVYQDYLDAATYLAGSISSLDRGETGNEGKLREIILARSRTLEPLRITTISLAQRLAAGRGFNKLSASQQSAVKEFVDGIMSFFGTDPRFDLLEKTGGHSYYYTLVHRAADCVLPAEKRLALGEYVHEPPYNRTEVVQKACDEMINTVIPGRWIVLANAYASAKAAFQ